MATRNLAQISCPFPLHVITYCQIGLPLTRPRSLLPTFFQCGPLQIPATTRRCPPIRLFLVWGTTASRENIPVLACFLSFAFRSIYIHTHSSALYATYPSQSTTPCSLASLSVLSFHLLFIDSLNAVHPSPFVQNFRRLSVTSPSSAIPPSPPPPQYRCNWLSYPSNRSFSWPKAHALCSSLPLALYTQLVSSSTHA